MKEEKIIELAILKAKEILQEAGHLGTLELDEDVMGEEVDVKKPKKNPSEEKLDNPQIDGYGHVGEKHYIGKELIDRYEGINAQLSNVNEEIAKAYVDGASSTRQELINKRIRIENSLDTVSKSILSKTVLDSMLALETIVKSTENYSPAFIETISKTMAELESLMDEFNAGEMDKDEYQRRYKRIRGSLHEEASSPGGHDSGDGRYRKSTDGVEKNVGKLDDLMARFKAGEITAEEMEREYKDDVRGSLGEEGSSPGGHDSGN